MLRRFGEYDFSRLLEEQNDLYQSRVRSVTLHSVDGAWDPQGDHAPRAAGRVSCKLTLVGESGLEVEQLLADLLQAMHAGRQKLWWFEKGLWLWSWAKCVSVAVPREARYSKHLPVALTFSVTDVYRYEKVQAGPLLYGQVGAYGVGKVYGVGDTISYAFSGLVTDFTMDVRGNARAIPTITIACAGGQSAQSVRVSRRVGGQEVQWFQANRTIASGKSLVVDVANCHVTYDGQDDYKNFTHGQAQWEWFRLLPGTNTIRVTCANAGNAGTITFSYYPTHY